MEEILDRPPSGCSIHSFGQRAVATVSLRSITGFVTTTGFALFWNGIVSVFVLIAIAGLYANLIGPLPKWFPAPGLNDGKPEMNGGPMELGMTLFLCVFLIPFVTVGSVMAGAAIMCLLGKVEVVIDEFDSYVATGFLFLKWKKRFDAKQVQGVEFTSSAWSSEGGSTRLIEIKSNRNVKFGSMLPTERMEWLRAVLKTLLLPTRNDTSTSSLPSLPWLSRTSL